MSQLVDMRKGLGVLSVFVLLIAACAVVPGGGGGNNNTSPNLNDNEDGNGNDNTPANENDNTLPGNTNGNTDPGNDNNGPDNDNAAANMNDNTGDGNDNIATNDNTATNDNDGGDNDNDSDNDNSTPVNDNSTSNTNDNTSSNTNGNANSNTNTNDNTASNTNDNTGGGSGNTNDNTFMESTLDVDCTEEGFDAVALTVSPFPGSTPPDPLPTTPFTINTGDPFGVAIEIGDLGNNANVGLFVYLDNNEINGDPGDLFDFDFVVNGNETVVFSDGASQGVTGTFFFQATLLSAETDEAGCESVDQVYSDITITIEP